MYKQLRLLTEQEEGYGIISEWNTRLGCSGFLSSSIQDKTLLREFEEQQEDKQTIFMNCILQKCDTENRNGRFYPREILTREDKKYQQLIQEGRAVGEANHPDCYGFDTEVLTKNGWKLFSQVSDDEIVFTLNPKTNKIEEHRINFLVDQAYKGEMYHFKGLNIDLVVTPNHRFLLEDRYGKRFFKTSEEIINSNSNKWKIIKTGEWDFTDEETFTIKGIKNPKHKSYELQDKVKKDLILNKSLFMAFMGIYLSEGHCRSVKSKNFGGYNVRVTQRKPETIKIIEDLFEKLFYAVGYNKIIRKNGTVDFSINDQRLFEYLYPLGSSGEKYIPEGLKNSSKENLQTLFNWFKIGDGRTIGKNNQSDVFSTSERLINDLHEVLLKTGGSGNIRKEERNIDRYIPTDLFEEVDNGFGELELVKAKRLIKGINSKPIYFLNISKSDNIWLDKRFIKISKIDYDDRIYCVNVQNNNIYVRRNGKSFWCGNTSNIDIKNISHRVIKSWWENNSLLGILEIMTSKGYHETGSISCTGDIIADLLRRGVKIGISSRGVGSLKNIHGKNTVQGDFELICYDLVASPSTPGAFLYPESEVKLNEAIKETNIIQDIKNPLIENLNNFLN